MGGKDRTEFEDDDLDAFDDFEDGAENDDSSTSNLESDESIKPYDQERINARHEIERRNELKALRSVLDDWDALLDEDDF